MNSTFQISWQSATFLFVGFFFVTLTLVVHVDKIYLLPVRAREDNNPH